MPEPSSSGESDALSPAVPSASAAKVDASAPAATGPTAGQTWADLYAVEAMVEFSSQSGRRKWQAHTLRGGNPVVLVEFAAPEREPRASLWPLLTEHPVRHLQRPREARGERVEAYHALPGEPLLQWRLGRTPIGLDLLTACATQIGGALQTLHSRGLAHLSVQPENIAVTEGENGWEFTLGALESIVAMARPDPIIHPVNPFYDPPEAIGLLKHSPGPDLRAWDWWSLGRTLQTLFLGQPVLGCVLGQSITKRQKEFQAQAADLTLERLPGALRAGAVEPMGRLDARFALLLQGLLTYGVEGRWGWPQLEEWAAGGNPTDYYKLPRTTRLFRWHDRGYTIADAAQAMRTPEHWDEGVRQVFGRGDPESLLTFVESAHGDRDLAAYLASLHQLAQSSSFNEYPATIIREVLAAIGLMELSGGKLVWRGEAVRADSLRHQLSTREVAEGFLGVQLLTHPKIRQQINMRDSATERFLRELAQTAEEAETLVAENRWWDLHDPEVRPRLWKLALGPVAVREEACARLRRQYAHSSRPEVDALLQKTPLEPAEQVLLAATAEEPERFGYVTHATREGTQHASLQDEGRRVRDALFWRQLGQAVEAGFWLFARGPAWIGLLTLFAVVGLIARPGPGWAALALAPAVFAALFRFLMQQSIADLVADAIPGAARWGWRDGAARCRAEARAAFDDRSPARLAQRLGEINGELEGLTLVSPPPQPISAPPGALTVWIAAVVSWIVLGSLGAFYGWSLATHPPSWPAIRAAWSGGAPEGPGRDAPVLELDVASTAPEAAPATNVDLEGMKEKLHEALAAEETYALFRGRQLAAAHADKLGEHPLAVLLEGETIRLMVFDAAEDALVSNNVFLRAIEPEVGETFGLGGVEVIYLGR